MKRVFILWTLLSLLFSNQQDDWDLPGYDCSDCHGSQGWTILDLSGFSHQFTNFPLEGSHQVQPCNACHLGNTTEEKHQFQRDASCTSCHLDVHLTNLGDECTQCHGINSWQVTSQTFDHNLTQFSLLGAHRTATCQACHAEGNMTQYNLAPTDCYSCHRIDYDQAQEPSHVLAGLDTECENCHSIQHTEWRPSTFDHDINTDYVLTGAHREAQCAGCHVGSFTDTNDECWSCHHEEFESAGTSIYPNAPVHTETIYSSDCTLCHTGTDTWAGGELDHALTSFPLTGLHETADCAQCHGEGVYTLPLTCEECHVPGELATTNYETSSYDHVAHNISSLCEDCHTTTGWDQNTFDHINVAASCEQCHLAEYQTTSDPDHSIIGYPTTDCESCHSVTEWEPIIFNHVVSTSCVTCHQLDYQNAVNPVHTQEEGYGENCEQCHLDTDTWLGAEFDHALSVFPLTGLHETADCAQCHGEGVYTLPLTCEECHIPGELATTNYEASSYDHVAHNISSLCEECHTTTGWDQNTFDHINVATSCEQCHLIEHQTSENPIHTNGNIRTECESCHSNENWTIDNFIHSAEQTDFPLAGLHIPTLCQECHLNEVYQGTENTCQSSNCHLNDFQTADPDHQLYGYPVDYCSDCHNEIGWTPDIYSHGLEFLCQNCHIPDYDNTDNPPHAENTGFPLTCDDCHETVDTWEGAVYNHDGVTTNCINCHMAEYDATTSPNHTDVGYNTACEDCHASFTDWTDATVDHSFYPISDDHLETTCAECHTQPQYQPSCWECHETDFNDEHSAGDNISCWECHTTFDWEDVSFDHTGTTSGCFECHEEDFQDEHDASYPTDCESCHTTDNWEDVNFSHSFPIDHGEENESCENCHPGGITIEFTCFSSGCHSASNETSDHCEDGAQDCESCNGFTYPYTGVTSLDCYSCHPNGDEDDCGDGDDRFGRDRKKDFIKPKPWKNKLF